MKVVGLIGQLNSGKNTLAEAFTHSKKFVDMALADPIKIILRDVFEVPTHQLWGPSDLRKGQVREMLQSLGTDFARKYDPDVWVRQLRYRLHYYKQTHIDLCFPGKGKTDTENVLITDIRFPNEANMLMKEFDAYLIKIVRPDSSAGIPEAHAQHESETAVQDISSYSHVIINDGTLEDLMDDAEEMVRLVCSR